MHHSKQCIYMHHSCWLAMFKYHETCSKLVYLQLNLYHLHNTTKSHYSDVTWAFMCIITTNWWFVQQAVQVNNKGNIEAPHNFPFMRRIHIWPGDSPHKGPIMWKHFHVMTSSCIRYMCKMWRMLYIFCQVGFHNTLIYIGAYVNEMFPVYVNNHKLLWSCK